MRGINNIYNNCFLNALVQALSPLEDFWDLLFVAAQDPTSHHPIPEFPRTRSRGLSAVGAADRHYTCVICVLSETLNELRNLPGGQLNPTRLIHLCLALDTDYQIGQFGDPKFVLMRMINAGYEAFSRLNPGIQLFKTERPYTVAWDTFKWQYVRRNVCTECKTVGMSTTEADILHLPFKGSMKKSFNEFFKEEVIELDCSNPRCGGKLASSRGHMANHPNTLVIEVQTYAVDGKGNPSGNSLGIAIHLPKRIDINRDQLSDSSYAPEIAGDGVDVNGSAKVHPVLTYNTIAIVQYEVASAVCELGTSDFTRHYFAKARMHGTWITFNDNNVSIAMEETGKMPAVLVFYKKVDLFEQRAQHVAQNRKAGSYADVAATNIMKQQTATEPNANNVAQRPKPPHQRVQQNKGSSTETKQGELCKGYSINQDGKEEPVGISTINKIAEDPTDLLTKNKVSNTTKPLATKSNGEMETQGASSKKEGLARTKGSKTNTNGKGKLKGPSTENKVSTQKKESPADKKEVGFLKDSSTNRNRELQAGDLSQSKKDWEEIKCPSTNNRQFVETKALLTNKQRLKESPSNKNKRTAEEKVTGNSNGKDKGTKLALTKTRGCKDSLTDSNTGPSIQMKGWDETKEFSIMKRGFEGDQGSQAKSNSEGKCKGPVIKKKGEKVTKGVSANTIEGTKYIFLNINEELGTNGASATKKQEKRTNIPSIKTNNSNMKEVEVRKKSSTNSTTKQESKSTSSITKGMEVKNSSNRKENLLEGINSPSSKSNSNSTNKKGVEATQHSATNTDVEAINGSSNNSNGNLETNTSLSNKESQTNSIEKQKSNGPSTKYVEGEGTKGHLTTNLNKNKGVKAYSSSPTNKEKVFELSKGSSTNTNEECQNNFISNEDKQAESTVFLTTDKENNKIGDEVRKGSSTSKGPLTNQLITNKEHEVTRSCQTNKENAFKNKKGSSTNNNEDCKTNGMPTNDKAGESLFLSTNKDNSKIGDEVRKVCSRKRENILEETKHPFSNYDNNKKGTKHSPTGSTEEKQTTSNENNGGQVVNGSPTKHTVENVSNNPSPKNEGMDRIKHITTRNPLSSNKQNKECDMNQNSHPDLKFSCTISQIKSMTADKHNGQEQETSMLFDITESKESNTPTTNIGHSTDNSSIQNGNKSNGTVADGKSKPEGKIDVKTSSEACLSVIKSTDDFNHVIEKSLEQGNCVLCRSSTKRYKQKMITHINAVHLKHSVSFNNQQSLACKLDCCQKVHGVHYHCPHCLKCFRKKYLLENHLKSLANLQTQAENKLSSLAALYYKECDFCHSSVQVKHLKEHMKRHNQSQNRINGKNMHSGVLIDRQLGMYIVSKSVRGNQYPLHVICKLSDLDQQVVCEDLFCRECYATASRSKDVTFVCQHVLSTHTISNEIGKKVLHEEYLHKLVEERRINKDRCKEIISKNNEAMAAQQPAVSEYFPNGTESRTFYLSIYTGKKESYARLKRTIIAVDIKNDRWTCACEKHKLKKGCGHKAMAKWYLREHHPEKLSSLKTAASAAEMNECVDISALEKSIESDVTPSFNGILAEKIKEIVEHIHTNRKMPFTLEKHILEKDNRDITDIIPTEHSCTCGKTLAADSIKLVTKTGMLVCIKYIKKDINVYHKQCTFCGNIFRYQSHEDNLFNYNDHIFLSLFLCRWMRHCIQNTIAPSKVIETIEEMHYDKIPVNGVRAGYLLFETLTDYVSEDSTLNCLHCGYHPVCQIFDGNHKVCFRMNESELQEDRNKEINISKNELVPQLSMDSEEDQEIIIDTEKCENIMGGHDEQDEENVTLGKDQHENMKDPKKLMRKEDEMLHRQEDRDNEVNTDLFWNNIEKSLIYKAVTNTPFSKDNPYYVKQSYKDFAPWISPKSSKGPFSINTEKQKIKWQQETGRDVNFSPTEDLNEDMLTYLKTVASKADAVELARACNINTSGLSMESIITLLERYVQEGTNCDKLFEKFSKKSRGIMMGMCTHGVVHCMKFMLAHESPRDVLDLQLSFKHPPNVTIVDTPRRLVTHGNNRCNLFTANDGLPCAYTEENIVAATNGTLKIEMDFLKRSSYQYTPESSKIEMDHTYSNNTIQQHPISKENLRYVLYDRLHEKNSTNECDRLLRSVKNIPDLRGELDTEIAEQKNAFLGKDKYFLDMMGHEHHLICVRSILLAKNHKINTKIRKKMEAVVQHDSGLELDLFGRILLNTSPAVKKCNGDNLKMNRRKGAKRKSKETLCHPEEGKKAKQDAIVPTVPVKEDEQVCGLKMETEDAAKYTEAEIQNPLNEKVICDNVFPPGYLYYHEFTKRIILSPYDCDIWRNARVSRRQLLSAMETNSHSLTPEDTPFMLHLESLERLMDCRSYLDGEIIDACLLVISGIISDENKSLFCVLPNQFLTTASVNTMKEWLPPSVSTGQCAGIVMAAHHPDHFCAVGINNVDKTIIYMDSCPGASSEQKKQNHVHKIKYLCSILDSQANWQFLMNNEQVATYFNISTLPVQSTQVDCGVFVILYLWMCLCRFTEGKDYWKTLSSLNLENVDMVNIRNFMSCLLLLFSGGEGVHRIAERSDTTKWYGLKLFPAEKKNKRMTDRILKKAVIDDVDRRKFLKIYFPDTLRMTEFLEKNKTQLVDLPPCLKSSSPDFKVFIHNVLNGDEQDFRDLILFQCRSMDGFNIFQNEMMTNKLRLNIEYNLTTM